MGSKYRLLSWINDELSDIEYQSVLDAFSGSGAVSYLFKTLGKQVFSNDFLHFAHIMAKATVENSIEKIEPEDVDVLLSEDRNAPSFIFDTFKDVFFTHEELRFLDKVSFNVKKIDNKYKQALALSCLIRSCAKKQPRGVFTISGDMSKYDDGRRDLRLNLEEHFVEQVEVYDATVFDNGENNIAFNIDVFEFDEGFYKPDLVYMDPPYVPRSDDNCYVKRYHFLEGLSKYWQDEEIMYDTKVKKIKKKYTPFSYRKTAIAAFDALFRKFADSMLVLSYSSNGFPDLEELTRLMLQYKSTIDVRQKRHRYHFGTHNSVKRSVVEEYLIVGK